MRLTGFDRVVPGSSLRLHQVRSGSIGFGMVFLGSSMRWFEDEIHWVRSGCNGFLFAGFYRR